MLQNYHNLFESDDSFQNLQRFGGIYYYYNTSLDKFYNFLFQVSSIRVICVVNISFYFIIHKTTNINAMQVTHPGQTIK